MIARLAKLLAAVALLAGAGAAPATRTELVGTAADRRVLVMLKLPPEHFGSGADYGGYGSGQAEGARRRLAARIAATEGLRLVDTWPMRVIGVDCVVMEVPDGRSTEAEAARLSKLHGVAWSQPMHLFEAQSQMPAARDPLYMAQPAAKAWRLDSIHRVATGRGAIVAVIDSRIDAAHPDLRGQVIVQKDFVGDGTLAPEVHGTGVAGIIAARADNGVGIAGVAPGARLMGLRACWQQPDRAAPTVCDSLTLAKAITFAIERNASIINLSLAGPADPLLARLVAAGLARGATVVAAYDRRQSNGGFPASAPGVVAVTDEGLATPRPGVYTAPGIDVPTTEPGGRWFLVSGNSFAAAHVSGLIALMRELRLRPVSHWLVASRGAGGAIDACGTLLRASRHAASSCALGQ